MYKYKKEIFEKHGDWKPILCKIGECHTLKNTILKHVTLDTFRLGNNLPCYNGIKIVNRRNKYRLGTHKTNYRTAYTGSRRKYIKAIKLYNYKHYAYIRPKCIDWNNVRLLDIN